MDLDIRKAFLSPFSGEKWFIKLLFPIMVTACGLISNPNLHIAQNVILIATLVTLLPDMILAGFFTQFQHNEIHNKISLLPVLSGKIKDYLVYGFVGLGITVVYVFFAYVFFFIIPEILKHIPVVSTLVNLASLLGFFAWLIVLVFALNSYADRFCFKDALNLKRIVKLISKTQILEGFWFILVAVALTACINLFSLFVNFMIILSPVVIIVMQLIIIDLAAQMYKIAKNRIEDIEKEPNSENQPEIEVLNENSDEELPPPPSVD